MPHLTLYKPHDAQATFHASRARFKVACFGRQAGKSTACMNGLIQKMWTTKYEVYWYVSPTYRQAKVIYRRMKRALQKAVANREVKKNDSDLTLTGPRGSVIHVVSGNEYDNLRGETLHGAVIDEVRDQPAELWPLVIRPMLTTTNGFCWFVSTGNGFDWFFDLHEKARLDDSGLWQAFRAPSTSNPLFTEQEVEIAKKDMSPQEFRQEILAEFVSLTEGTAYYSYSEKNERLDSPLGRSGDIVCPQLPIELYMDFNVRPLAWSIGQFRNGTGHYFFEEIFLRGTRSNTSEGIREFIQRFSSWKIKANPAVIIIGDATGNAQKTASAGQTDYTIITQALEQAGITYENLTPDSNPPVKDRVNTVNARLCAADGSVQLWLHPLNCPNLKKDFQRVVWKQGATAILDQNKDPMLTHSSDGVGYGICVRNPIEKNEVGKMRILRR